MNASSVDSVAGERTVPAPPPGRTPARARARPAKSARATVQKWVRRLHSWLSMTSLLIVLFFALTGVTLNHPTWLGASTPRSSTSTGVLPASTVGNGTADPLAISEYLRTNLGVTGQVTAHAETPTGGTIDYDGPGTSASVAYTTSTRAFSLKTTTYGLVGVLNDLHKGRHAGTSFRWLIDLSGGLLTLVAVTGLVLQLYIRRSRTTGLVLVGIGAVAGIVLMVLNR